MFELYAAIWRVSWKQQILLLVLSIAIAALAALPLAYQKDIINALTDGSADRDSLLLLCAQMMGVILLSLGLKNIMFYRSGCLGEDTVRRLRKRIFRHAADPEQRGAKPVAEGTQATMISAEAEELGKFTGSAFSDPVMQIGTLLSVIGFIASSQPRLGMLALCVIVPQVVLVLLTQRQVNRLVAERVRLLRQSTNAALAQEALAAEAEILADFDRIYEVRREMYIWKLSTKFILSTLNGGGTVAVLLLGGWMVIEGATDVGTIVAATAGLARLQGPTTFLIAFYRKVSATQVKFALLQEVLLPERRG